MIKPKNIIVIGGNAAGPAAAAKAKRTNPEANVIMFEASSFISTGTCELPYVISGEIKSYKDIVFFDAESFRQSKGVEVFTNHLVTSIDRRNKKVIVKNLNENSIISFDYDTVVLCTGSQANKIAVVNDCLANVFYLKNISDLNLLTDFLNDKARKRCLVIGAGYIGLEVADCLHKIGCEVFINDSQNFPMSSAEPEIQSLILNQLKNNSVEFISGQDSFQIFCDDEKVKKIKFNGRLIDIDFVLIAAGFNPNNQLAMECKLDVGKSGALRVNRKLQTSDSNIYAAGDNIETINPITGRFQYLPLATVAHSSGHIAGGNAAGGYEVFKPVLRNIAVNFFNLCYAQVGLTKKEAMNNFNDVQSVDQVAFNKVKVMPDSSKTFAKVLYRRSNKQILGASFIGGQEVVGYSDLISSLIYTKSDVRVLAELDYNYTPPLSPFINILSMIGRKIQKETS
jgi:NADPH-dependent 2,4-dienoyl-CoA reductase/sulfur reductase-like enzyme